MMRISLSFANGFLCALAVAGAVSAARAYTVEETSEGWTGIIASGESHTFSTTNDFVVGGKRLDFIKLTDNTSYLLLADGFESDASWFRFGSTGYIRILGNVTFNRYYAYSGSVQGQICNGGTATFDCPFDCATGNGWFQMRSFDSSTCQLVLNRNGNKFAQFRFTGNVGVRLGCADALYSTGYGLGALAFNGATGTGPGLDLNGHSTRVKALNGADLMPTEGASSFALVTSASPATLEVQSLSYNAVEQSEISFPFKFADKASFLFNADGRTLNLVNVVSTSSGDLGVAGGVLVMKWNAGWSGDTVTVTGGVFQVDSAKTFSNSNVCLAVRSPGAVVLNQDIYVDRLVVDGKEIDPGKSYATSELDNFSGPGVISVRYSKKDPVYASYVWTLDEEGASVSAAGVWKDGAKPNLSDGGATLVFSEGGRSAAVTKDITIFALEFLSTFPFSLDGTPGKTMTMAGGIAVDAASSATVTATVGADIEMTTANTAGWTVGANAALSVTGSLSGQGVSTLPVSGEGSLYLSGDASDLKRPFNFSNPLVVVSNRTALGTAEAAFGEQTVLRFDCLTNDAPIRITGAAYVGGVRQNRPNVAGLGSLALNGAVNLGSDAYLDGGGMHFRGGIVGSQSGNLNLYCFGSVVNGTVRGTEAWIENTPLTLTGGVGARFLGQNGTLHLAIAGNTYPDMLTVNNYYSGVTGTIKCHVENALDPLRLFGFGRVDNGQNGVLDLNGHDQQVLALATYAYNDATHVTERGQSCGVVTSAVPATLTISGKPYYAYGNSDKGSAYFQGSGDAKATYSGHFSPTNSVAFRGEASLVFAATGDKVTSFVNGKSDTAGTLTVESGTLVFDWGAGWTATTNVTISGGTLRIMPESADCAFGPSAGKSGAGLYLNGSGTLDLPEAVRTTVRSLSVNGTYRSAGVYGGPEAGLDADHTVANLSGKGRLSVLKSGFMPGLVIIIR